MSNLSKMQRRVFDTFRLRGYDKDVPITVLYASAYPDQNASGMTSRDMQMRLAPLFLRINAKLSASRIIVGEFKRTYRIVRKG